MVIKRKYPLKHISIRVPWNDIGWDGRVCKNPKSNTSCLRLKKIALERDDVAESKIAGHSIKDLNESEWPCCVQERGLFMAPFEFTRIAHHPYAKSSPGTHGHFIDTPLRHPPYSAPIVPFRWMLLKNMEKLAKEYDIPVKPDYEPELPFKSEWVQERTNQMALLNCFTDHIKPETSLCFFYAKQVPFLEDSRRVIIGVGKVKHIGEITEYEYSKKGNLRCVLWERMIQHSIRPSFNEGFILPYHQAIEHADKDSTFNPEEIAAIVSNDRMLEFSYASELVTNDGAIASLLACVGNHRNDTNNNHRGSLGKN